MLNMRVLQGSDSGRVAAQIRACQPDIIFVIISLYRLLLIAEEVVETLPASGSHLAVDDAWPKELL